jgi:hypothetical protein
MRFEFTPNPKDYQKVLRTYYLSDRRLWILIVVLGLPEMCCNLYFIAVNGWQNSILSILLLLFLPAFILYMLVFTPWNYAQKVKNDDRLKAKTTWIVSDDEIFVKNEYAESKIPWEQYDRVIESRAYYMFFAQGHRGMTHMLPKRAFFTVDQELKFQKMVFKKVAKYRVLQYF